MKLISIILFVFLLTPVHAATIEEVFGDGVFGLHWGDSPQKVTNKFPTAKKKNYQNIVWFEVKDSRSVLGIDRKNKLINFSFDSESRLAGVAIYFDSDDYGAVLVKLNTLFGEYTKVDGGQSAMQWRGGEVVLTLVFVPSGLGMEATFSISYSGLDKPDVDKGSLGFN